MNKFEYLEKELNVLTIVTDDLNELAYVAEYNGIELHLLTYSTYVELYLSATDMTIELFDTDITDKSTNLNFVAVNKQAQHLDFAAIVKVTDLMLDHVDKLITGQKSNFEEFEALMQHKYKNSDSTK